MNSGYIIITFPEEKWSEVEPTRRRDLIKLEVVVSNLESLIHTISAIDEHDLHCASQ